VAIAVVDAFTESPFAGNPAAVCVLDAPAGVAWMQNVAMELNLSETAFLHPAAAGWALRWFTPALEVDLCGHATLASAHLLWEDRRLAPEDEACFQTRSGLLTARRAGGRIEMSFPLDPCTETVAPDGLIEALGIEARFTGRGRFDYIVEVGSEAVVRHVAPDFALLSSVETRGVIVTARSAAPGYDFVSRFFAPAAGIPEDPVTGSAHCCLAPYWAQRLGRDELVGYQASRRGGVVHVRLEDDRVILGGAAVTVWRGALTDAATVSK
jgi:PhzF family phenazine biosynthesis protein